MRIVEKFRRKAKNLKDEQPVCIAFLGDSVTQGCFDDYATSPHSIDTVYDPENAYHAKLKKILNMLYPNVPLNIINAGISGGKAFEGIRRLERDVLRFSPDLCVVCFGLNDSCDMQQGSMEIYKTALTSIFKELLNHQVEVIFMTPNMMCTSTSWQIKDPLIRELAPHFVKVQTEGRLEQFLAEAKRIAADFDIPVCDCYQKWKILYESGVSIDGLLANKTNHPTKDMNWLFAYSLAETIFTQ